jgi:TPP-dependent pyruvate/acetoin dehydrogenase alpha subunit
VSTVDENRLLAAYRLMLLSRAVDDACDELVAQGVPVPNYHGARGQEALYAGVGICLQPEDQLLYNYRAFATLLAKGVTIEELMGDLLMNAAGTSSGHGGIMHVTAPDRGIVGRNGVFGSKFGIALGLAQEIVLNKRQAAVVCMFGEAEGNRGGLYEAMNIAALRRLPVVFVAENNGYAVAATTDLLYSTGDMSGAVSGFPMSVTKVDGNDVEVVADHTERFASAARSGKGPAYLECVTSRLDPHHAHDDQSRYRDASALEDAWALEPLGRARTRLLELGTSEEKLAQEQQRAQDRVAAAVRTASAAQPASIDLAYSHTYYQEVTA